MAAYRQAALGKAFEIVAGESVSVGDYVLMALRVPAAHQGEIRVRRPSGDFALIDNSTESLVDFTLHGDKNFFGHGDVLVQILMQTRDTARCIIWPAPPISQDRAIELARAAVNESGHYSDMGPETRTHVHWCGLTNVVSGQRRLAWQVHLVSREDARSLRGYSGSVWGRWHAIVVDAATGEVLKP